MNSNLTPDDQTRATLRPLLDRAIELLSGETVGNAKSSDSANCPNCDRPTDSERSPYCSHHCKEVAAFVRQFRGSLADGSVFDEERMASFGQKWWSVQGGGYPRRQLMVPAKTIEKVIARDGGLCSICGAPATEIDHTGSG